MSATDICDMCHKNFEDPIEHGEMMKKSNVQVHYYCLLLSTHLPQRGDDNGGILGFLLRDIQKEIKACQKRVCCYCHEGYASIKCNQCDLYYHHVCGLKNDCLFQFVDEFISYCHNHCVITHEKPHDPSYACYICLRSMGTYNPVTSITAECCDLNCWVHRRCMKEYALSAGYYLQCLWCKSKELRDYVRRHGVFVPDRDALWEQKGAFRDLYKRYAKCDADVCLCSKGRTYKRGAPWNILVCSTCAASGVHKGCLPKNKTEDNFQCSGCCEILVGNIHLSQSNNRERSWQQISSEDKPLEKSLFMNKSQVPCKNASALDQSLNTNESRRRLPREILCKNQDFTLSNIKSKSKCSNSLSLSLSKKCQQSNSVNNSNLKPWVGVNPKDKSKIAFLLLDSDNKVVHQEPVVKFEIDDDLIAKLVEDVEKNHSLHNHIIEVSEDDDSGKSVEDLFEAMQTHVNVPKPKANSSKSKKSQQLKAVSKVQSVQNVSMLGSSNDSRLYPVTQETNTHVEDLRSPTDKSLSLGDKIGLYFENYREGTPELN